MNQWQHKSHITDIKGVAVMQMEQNDITEK